MPSSLTDTERFRRRVGWFWLIRLRSHVHIVRHSRTSLPAVSAVKRSGSFAKTWLTRGCVIAIRMHGVSDNSKSSAAKDLTPFRVTAKVQQSVWQSLGDFDVIADLPNLHVPAFFVHGRHDPIPIDSTERAASAMRARLLVLEASGHVPYVEQPDALFSAIEQYLAETTLNGGEQDVRHGRER
jgi:pimeloyl-ACP methyl ester carboxylesterase